MLTLTLLAQKEDIRAAVLYLRAQGRSVTGLVGHSKAGTGVILYAADYDDIPRVVNVAGRYDNMRGKCRPFLQDLPSVYFLEESQSRPTCLLELADDV